MPHRRATWIVLTFMVLALMPAAAWAQATIAGIVRDSSGAVLPGVTVEASSDVLIEKVRTAVTDGTGRYQIVDLRAGTYAVTFTLTGFSTVKREGIELTGLMTATVSADLRVGAVQETITVTGESPMVDVQSVRRQTTITGEVLSEIPTARGYTGVMLLVPAIQTQGSSPANVQATPGMVVFGTPGGRNGNEGRLAGGRPWRRRGAKWRRCIRLQRGHRECAGDLLHGLRRPRRGRSLRTILERRPEDGRELVARVAVPGRGERRHGRQQLHAGAAGRRPRRAGPSAEVVGFHRRHRRPDQERPNLVLLEPSQSRIALVSVGHVREPERRRSHQVDLPGGHNAAVTGRRQLDGRQPSSDAAGDTAQQVQHLLGRAEALHRRNLFGQRRWVPDATERGRIRLRRFGGRRAGDSHLREPVPACAAAHVEFADDQPRPADRGIWRLPHALGWRRDARQPDAQPRSCHRTVRAELPTERRHPEPDLSIRELGVALDGAAQLERVDDLRDRRAQPEVRLPGHLLRRRRAGPTPTTRRWRTASTTANPI